MSNQEQIDTILVKEKLNLGIEDCADKSLQALLNAKPSQDSEIDVISYLNENFSTVESLDNVDSILKSLDSQILSIDEQLKEVMRDQAYAAENARAQLDAINERSVNIIDRIQNVKQSAIAAETIVKEGCAETKRLDTAKRNITFSITSLKRLMMLSKCLSILTCFSLGHRKAKNCMYRA